MTKPYRTRRCYRFADLKLDTGRREVRRDGMPIDLPKLSFDALVALVVNAPNVVSHDELATFVWGDERVVTLENIAQRVMMLRRRLGDSSADPRYIKGVRGFGYRLIPDVAVMFAPNGSPRADLSEPLRPERTVRSSIAVLPFARADADPREARLAQRLHDEVTECIARLTALKVLPQRVSRQGTKGADRAMQSFDRLTIDWIVKGSLEIMMSRVRVAVRLVDPSTGSSVWSRSYMRDVADALSLQTDIASDLVLTVNDQLHATPQVGVGTWR